MLVANSPSHPVQGYEWLWASAPVAWRLGPNNDWPIPLLVLRPGRGGHGVTWTWGRGWPSLAPAQCPTYYYLILVIVEPDLQKVVKRPAGCVTTIAFTALGVWLACDDRPQTITCSSARNTQKRKLIVINQSTCCFLFCLAVTREATFSIILQRFLLMFFVPPSLFFNKGKKNIIKQQQQHKCRRIGKRFKKALFYGWVRAWKKIFACVGTFFCTFGIILPRYNKKKWEVVSKLGVCSNCVSTGLIRTLSRANYVLKFIVFYRSYSLKLKTV